MIRRPTWWEAWQGPLFFVVGVLLICVVLAYYKKEGVFADPAARDCCPCEDR